MNKTKILFAALIVAIISLNALAQTRIDPKKVISEATMRKHIKYLADDSLEGRGTGAKGGQLAAQYIAAQLKALGLRGAGASGSFFQPVSLFGVKADPNTTLTVSAKDKKETFKFADEFVAFTGAQTPEVKLNNDMIFVGYGINAPEQRWNDYKGDANEYSCDARQRSACDSGRAESFWWTHAHLLRALDVQI